MRSPGFLQPTTPHGPLANNRHDGEPHGHDLGRLLLGLTVLTIGAVFLLDALGVLNADRAIDHWWPVVIVAGGLLTLAERPPALMRGTILTGIGVVLLLFTTDLLHRNAWNYVWPAVVIILGLVIVLRWRGRAVITGANEEDVVRSTAVFGGPNLVCTSRQFAGAWLTAVFGGITLDLRDALPIEGAAVNATAAFGGIDILVPKGWRISVRSTPIFGGLDDKTDHSEPPAADAPALRIDALTMFGGVAIKHEK
jgi:predicted membrane protein